MCDLVFSQKSRAQLDALPDQLFCRKMLKYVRWYFRKEEVQKVFCAFIMEYDHV